MSQGTGKLNTSMWEQQASGGAAPAPTTGNKAKAAMFEQKIADAAPKAVEKKKTWKSTGNTGTWTGEGKFKGQTVIGNGPPPKKSLTDLP